MRSPRIAPGLTGVLAALLLAWSVCAGAGPGTTPTRPPGMIVREPAFVNEESGHETEYFDGLTGGRLDGDRYRAILKAAASVRPESPPARATAVNTWQLVGPLYSVNTGGGNMTGRVRDIDAHNQRVLAASGGLWRFHFGAIAMSDSVPATWFGSFASNPSDANTVLLGTGEIFFGESGTGLYKTTDGGATWTHKPMVPDPSAFSRVR